MLCSLFCISISHVVCTNHLNSMIRVNLTDSARISNWHMLDDANACAERYNSQNDQDDTSRNSTRLQGH